MKADKLREKFQTAAGRKAFDQLNKLGAPEWTVKKAKKGIYLMPSMVVTIPGSNWLRDFSDGFGATFDHAAVQLAEDLKRSARIRSMLIITNPASKTDRSVHQYNTVTKRYNKL